MAEEKDPLPLVDNLDDCDLKALLNSPDTTTTSSDQPSLDMMKSPLQDVDANNLSPEQLTCLECHQPVLAKDINQHIYCRHMTERLILCSFCPFSVKYNLASMIIHCRTAHSDLCLEAEPIDQRDLNLTAAEELRQKCFPHSTPLGPCNSEAERASVAKKLAEWELDAPTRQLAKARQEKLFPAAVKKRKSNEMFFEPLSPSPLTDNDHHSPSLSGEGSSSKRWHTMSADAKEEEEEPGEEEVENDASLVQPKRTRQQCAICSTNVRTCDSGAHIWIHHMEATPRFLCSYCQRTFKSSKTNLINHQRQVHPTEVLAFVDRKDEVQAVYYETFSRCFGPGNCMRSRYSKPAASSDLADIDSAADTEAIKVAETAEFENESDNGEDMESDSSELPTNDSSSLDAHQAKTSDDTTRNIFAIFGKVDTDNAKDLNEGTEGETISNATVKLQQTPAATIGRQNSLSKCVAMVRDLDKYAAVLLQMAFRLKKLELNRACADRLKAKLLAAPALAMNMLIVADQMNDVGLMEMAIDVIKGDSEQQKTTKDSVMEETSSKVMDKPVVNCGWCLLEMPVEAVDEHLPDCLAIQALQKPMNLTSPPSIEDVVNECRAVMPEWDDDTVALLDVALSNDNRELLGVFTEELKATLTATTAVKTLIVADLLKDDSLMELALNMIIGSDKEQMKLVVPDCALLFEKPLLLAFTLNRLRSESH